jgi:triosephosphate isomerase
MRIPIIAGNWKMHKSVKEALSLVEELCPLVDGIPHIEVVVCPPYTALYPVGGALAGKPVKLAAQDVFWEKQGAFTGQISPGMLVDAGCQYVIIGHSERRQYFGETDETVNKKIKAALAHGLTPILCVGETLEQREDGETELVVARQIDGGLTGLKQEQVAGMVVAYEPVWAIGTGRTASAEDANSVCDYIRRRIANLFGMETAQQVRIQYGGSVKPESIAELMAQSDIDGALVGGASLDAVTFSKIVKYK